MDAILEVWMVLGLITLILTIIGYVRWHDHD